MRLVPGLEQEPACRFGPSAELLPARKPRGGSEVAAVERQIAQRAGGGGVLTELELGLAEETARAYRRRVVGDQPLGGGVRLPEAMLGEQGGGQNAKRRAVAAGPQAKRAPRLRFGAQQVVVARHRPAALQVQPRELGDVAGAQRVARRAPAIELDVRLADARCVDRASRGARCVHRACHGHTERERGERHHAGEMPSHSCHRGLPKVRRSGRPPQTAGRRRVVSWPGRGTGRWRSPQASRRPRCPW